MSTLAAIGAYLSGQLITALIKLANNVPLDTLVFARLFMTALFALPYGMYYFHKLRELSLIAYTCRGLIRYAAICCTYYGYRNLSMQTAGAIGLTEPFFVILLSRIVLGEKLSREHVAWLVVGYLGACISLVSRVSDAASTLTAVAVMLSANILAAISIVLARVLAQKDEITTATALLSLLMPIISFPSAYYSVSFSYSSALSYLPLAVALGLVGLLHTGLYQFAIKHSSASFVSSFQYTKIPAAIILDLFAFGNPVDYSALVSSVIILYVAWKISQIEVQ